ncbi:hypothetical protein [Micromonospora cremea]|uniref:hypothetical protein n=1 Tax=Micromonospora cremea TaxID=709881 RepID=UPI00117F0432|nr:hypothetical protein [Micromonospora cremea]
MKDWDHLNRLIVEGRRIQAVQAIRASCGCAIPEALDMLAERYALLRAARPDDFKQSHDDYWQGVFLTHPCPVRCS